VTEKWYFNYVCVFVHAWLLLIFLNPVACLQALCFD